MTATKLHKLAELGQSVWLDYMQRSLINSSGLRTYVEQGLRGITSNPAIFEKAISQSNLYDGQIHELGVAGRSAEEICAELLMFFGRCTTPRKGKMDISAWRWILTWHTIPKVPAKRHGVLSKPSTGQI